MVLELVRVGAEDGAAVEIAGEIPVGVDGGRVLAGLNPVVAVAVVPKREGSGTRIAQRIDKIVLVGILGVEATVSRGARDARQPDILVRIHETVLVEIEFLVQVSIAVDVLVLHTLAAVRRREPAVFVPILSEQNVQPPVVVEVLEQIESMVAVVVLPGIALPSLVETVRVPP